MTFTAVGSTIAPSVSSQAGGTSVTFSLTPNTIGDFILLIMGDFGSSNVPVSASSSNVTWSTLGSSYVVTNSTFAAATPYQAFIGIVTSTSAQTVTVTYAGTTAFPLGTGQEFSSTVLSAGGSVLLDQQGDFNSGTPGGQDNWVSLTPSYGAGELYYGFAQNNGAAADGSTSGYVYNANADTHEDGSAYNVDCPNSATFPVWGDTSQCTGIMVLVYEAAAAFSSLLPQAVRAARFPNRRQQPTPTYSASGPVQYTETLLALLAADGSVQRGIGRLIAAALGVVSVCVRSVGRFLAAVLGVTGSVLKRTGRILSGSVGVTDSTVRSVGKSLPGEVGVTGNVARKVGRNIAAALGVTATTIRSTSRAITAVIAATAATTTIKVKLVFVTAVTGVTAAISRNINRNISAQAGVEGSVQRGLSTHITATAAATANLIRSCARSITAIVAATATTSTIKVKLVVLTAVAGITGATSRALTKLIPATAAAEGTVQRQIARKIAAAAAVTATTVKQLPKTFTAAVAVFASEVAVEAALAVNLIAQAAVTAAQRVAISAHMSAAVAAATGVVRRISRAIKGTAASAPSLVEGRQHFLAIAATVATGASVVTRFIQSSVQTVFKLGVPVFRWVSGNVRKNWRIP